MMISSRTPEGQPNHCPVCDADVRIDPSPLFGDATCPRCGSLLWFLNIQPHTHIFQRSRSNSIRDRVIQIVAEQLGVDADRINKNPSLVNDLGADSLDTVELVMELEEEFDLDAVNASVGDRVRVVSGHFENFEGTVDTIDRESGRVTIGITIFGRTTLVELESWEVQRIGA